MKKDLLKGLCLIEIGGDSCANCLAVMPMLNVLAKQFALKFVKINIEEQPELAKGFEIDRIPAIILAEDGVPFAQCSGYQPPEILEYWIEAKLERYDKNEKGDAR